MSEELEPVEEDFVVRETEDGKWEALTGDDELLGTFDDGGGALTIIAQAMIEAGDATNVWFAHPDGEYELLDGFDPHRLLGSHRPGRRRRGQGRDPRRAPPSEPERGVSRRSRRRRRRGVSSQSLRRSAEAAREGLSETGAALAAFFQDTKG